MAVFTISGLFFTSAVAEWREENGGLYGKRCYQIEGVVI